MPDRAALVTGASRGIGLALADALGDEGYALTISARKPDTLEQTAESCAQRATRSRPSPANMADEDAIAELVAAPRSSAASTCSSTTPASGSAPAPASSSEVRRPADRRQPTRDRAAVPRLPGDAQGRRRRASQRGRDQPRVDRGQVALALAVCVLGDQGGVLAYTTAMNKELGADGIKSTAFAPGFVDTDMTDFVKGAVPSEEMIRPRTSPRRCASCCGCRPTAWCPRSCSGDPTRRCRRTCPRSRGSWQDCRGEASAAGNRSALRRAGLGADRGSGDVPQRRRAHGHVCQAAQLATGRARRQDEGGARRRSTSTSCSRPTTPPIPASDSPSSTCCTGPAGRPRIGRRWATPSR